MSAAQAKVNAKSQSQDEWNQREMAGANVSDQFFNEILQFGSKYDEYEYDEEETPKQTPTTKGNFPQST